MCESAIYFNISLDIIKESGVFETFTDFKPPPEMLETERGTVSKCTNPMAF